MKAKRKTTKASKPATKRAALSTTRSEVLDITAKQQPYMLSVKFDTPTVDAERVAAAFGKVMAILDELGTKEAKVRVVRAAAIILGVDSKEPATVGQPCSSYTFGG